MIFRLPVSWRITASKWPSIFASTAVAECGEVMQCGFAGGQTRSRPSLRKEGGTGASVPGHTLGHCGGRRHCPTWLHRSTCCTPVAEHGGVVQRGAGREARATLESDPMSRCMPQLVLVPHADLPTVLHSRPKKVQVDAVFEHGLLGRLIEGPQPLGRAGGRAAAHSGAKRRTDQCEVPADATRVWLFADETTFRKACLQSS